jgi:hypothetical protein
MSLASLAAALGPDAPHRPSAMPENAQGAPAPSPAAPGAPPKSENGFALLTRYIPTETITLYVAAVAATSGKLKLPFAGLDAAWAVYVIFAAVTPLLLWLLAFGEYRRVPGTVPFAPPWWPMLAATAAFLVWAASVPGNPLALAASGLPGLAAMILSTLLSILDPIFLKPTTPTAK